MKAGRAIALALGLVACQPDPAPVIGVRAVRTPAVGTTPTPAASPPPGVAAIPRSPLPASVAPSPATSDGVAASPSPTPTPTTTPTPRLTPTPLPAPPSPVLSLVVAPQAPDSWQTGPTLQRARSGLVAAAADGILYAAEGENRASVETLALVGSGAWALTAPADPGPGVQGPIGRRLAVLGGDGHKVLAAGGDDAEPSDLVVSYTTGGATLAGRLTNVAAAAAGGLVGQTLIVAGGLDKQRHVTAAVQELNVQTQAIVAGADMPLAVAGAASAVLGDKVYVFGGYTLAADGSLTPQAAVQVFDSGKNAWQRDGDGQVGSPPALALARHSAAACALDGTIYLVGGAGAGNGVLSGCTAYDPVANTYRELAAMPTARALHGLAAFDGRLWAIGGRGTDGRALASVEVYRP